MRLLNHDAPLILGGLDVVHIDKSLFRHKPKVWYSCTASSLSDCQHFKHDPEVPAYTLNPTTNTLGLTEKKAILLQNSHTVFDHRTHH